MKKEVTEVFNHFDNYTVSFKNFIEDLNEVFDKMSAVYNSVDVSVSDIKFIGKREETEEELRERLEKEEKEKESIKKAELKEYLRLHKIYGK